MIKPKKSLGQNFLTDRNILEKIIGLTKIEKKSVLEVGPGTGNLTSYILKNNPKKVFLIEKDENLVSFLANEFEEKVTIINNDVLDVNEKKIFKEKLTVFGNLPYNISTEILCKWILNLNTNNFWFDCLILMFQKEVANRIVASPGSKAYGRLSVMAQWRCNTKIAFNIPATAFTPPPKVESSIVHFEALKEPRFPAEVNKLEFVVSKAFNQRRKMLRGALKGHFKNVEEGLLAIGVVPTKRAENVTIQEFCLMAQILVRT